MMLNSGYQPENKLDTSKPPQGGSAVPIRRIASDENMIERLVRQDERQRWIRMGKSMAAGFRDKDGCGLAHSEESRKLLAELCERFADELTRNDPRVGL